MTEEHTEKKEQKQESWSENVKQGEEWKDPKKKRQRTTKKAEEQPTPKATTADRESKELTPEASVNDPDGEGATQADAEGATQADAEEHSPKSAKLPTNQANSWSQRRRDDGPK